MLDDVYLLEEEKMQKSVEKVLHDFNTIRTGRANTSLLESVKVDAYGSSMPINQVGTISAPEPRLLTVQPWDKSLIGAIEKALLKSDLGLTPMNDGNLIRLPIPELNEERRKDLVKHARHLAEEGRIAIRNIRRDANERIKKMEKSGEISEDLSHDGHNQIQEFTDTYIKKIDELLQTKESELLEV